jgi:hypothetical protein
MSLVAVAVLQSSEHARQLFGVFRDELGHRGGRHRLCRVQKVYGIEVLEFLRQRPRRAAEAFHQSGREHAVCLGMLCLDALHHRTGGRSSHAGTLHALACQPAALDLEIAHLAGQPRQLLQPALGTCVNRAPQERAPCPESIAKVTQCNVKIVHRLTLPFGRARCGGSGEFLDGDLDTRGFLQYPLQICPANQPGGCARRLSEERTG